MTAIRIFSKTGCNHCEMAKEFLEERSMDYEEINMDGRAEDIEQLKKDTGHTTFPFIFIDETRFIGGLRELIELYDF